MEPATDRTISSNKPEIIIHNNKQKNMNVNRCCNFWRQNVIQKEAEKIVNYKGTVPP